MSELARPSLLHRLTDTPMRDLLRGRVTGRLGWKRRLAAVDLPASATHLIHRVVKRTRLWRLEKAALADELIGHFHDALAAGNSVEAIVAGFGDERRAARLIRRAKIRNRPLVWHVQRWIGRLLLLTIAIYVALLLPCYLSRPTPRIDYLAVINKPVLDAPPSDIAWPLYHRAILGMLRKPTGNPQYPFQHDAPTWLSANLDGPTWPQAQAWLEQHQSDIELLRQAAAKPMMGFVLSRTGGTSDPQVYPVGLGTKADSSSSQSSLLEVLLPQLTDCRSMELILSADAKLAETHGDAHLVQRDVEAMLGMAQQLRGPDDFLVTYLVAMGCDQIAFQTATRVLMTDPSLLGDRQWIELAHQISQPRTDADLTGYAAERLFIQDVLQRVYTDDGRNNGHITAAGMDFLLHTRSQVMLNTGDTDLYQRMADRVAPLFMPLIASRKAAEDAANQLFDEAQADLDRPAREVDFKKVDDQIDRLSHSLASRIGFSPLYQFMPDFAYEQSAAERDLGAREGLTTAIALELYRRQHGEYPAQLSELAPLFMPVVPADRITGDPIKYKLVDGKPLLYSVGVDRVDDGGKAAVVSGRLNYILAARWDPAPCETGIRGDWILYPQTPER